MTGQQTENPFTPENIAATENVAGVDLSPDGQKVIYHLQPPYKAGEHDTSAIWIADVQKAESAKALTSGLFNDSSAVFHPDGERVVFLSDRHKAGGPRQICSINISGGEASPLIPTTKENEKGVSKFAISPDGRFIAFLSADEPTAEDKRKKEKKDDAQVFGDQRGFQRLRIYSLSTSDVRTLNIPKDRHVDFVTWKPDSKEVLFVTHSSDTMEAACQESRMERIAIAPGTHSPTLIGTYPFSPSFAGNIVWTAGDNVAMIQSFDPYRFSDAKAIFIKSLVDKAQPARYYGDDEDGSDVRGIKNTGLLAVTVEHGVDTRIDIFHETTKKFTIFDTDREHVHGCDVRKQADGTYVFVAITTSSIKRETMNVRVGFAKEGERVKLSATLSSHLVWMENAPVLHTEIFRWKGEDGLVLEGIAVFPSDNNQPDKPLPTILHVHGGPYSRDVPLYTVGATRWSHVLASRGYLVLCPNYRGGSGRGSKFARAAHAGMGTIEWSDCEGMVDEAIHRKLADATRLGIGGWSQGGFMTAWGVTKTKNKFKAGVMGAGVSDWGQMAAESDLPEFEADLGGSAPWTPGERIDLKGSPIRYVQDVETALLILHGEKDERVPVTQAISMMRGLRRQAKYPERSQLVIYPREPHGPKERAHAVDILKRVIEHFDTWL